MPAPGNAMHYARLRSIIAAALIALPTLAGSEAAAGTPRESSRGEWMRVSATGYARIDWDRVARVDLRPVHVTRPPVVELHVVRRGALRQSVTITWPSTAEAVQRRLSAEADDWVALGPAVVAPVIRLPEQYVNLDQVRYVQVLPGSVLAGDEVVLLYGGRRQGERVLLGQVQRPREVRKVRRAFATAFQ